MTRRLTEDKVVEALRYLLEDVAAEEPEGTWPWDTVSTSTFREAALLTYNKGLVVRCQDGEGRVLEFQVEVQEVRHHGDRDYDPGSGTEFAEDDGEPKEDDDAW